ncbi:MAG TPA: DUF4142 domain-containing protein [Pyrinomonadaceae bacterium]
MGKRIVWIALCAFFGLALSFAGLSSARTAQNSNSGTTGQNSNGVGGANTNETGARTGNQSGGQMGGQMGGALSSQDRKFAMNAAMSDMFEIESSRLALERATSDHVKQMAQQLIDDHTRTSGELAQLAQARGMTPPAQLDSKHAGMLMRLRGMSGAQFEREYVRQAGVKAHESAVKLFRDQSRKGRDADLRAFAARTLPALEGHLQMARGHAGMHGGGGSMNNANRNSNSNMGGNSNNSNR